MSIRLATLALAAALAVVASGCGEKCGDQTPPVAGVPACTAVASEPLTVPIRVCPRCDQGAPTCIVHPETGGQITLEPVSEVCDPSSSCPLVDPASCQFAPLNCTFTAPATPATYRLVVVTPEGVAQRDLTVVAAGGTTSCGPPTLP